MCYKDYYALNNKLVNIFKLSKENISIPKNLYIEEIEVKALEYLISNFQHNFELKNNSKTLTILNMEYILKEIDETAKKCVNDINGFA